MALSEVMDEVKKLNTKGIIITGGEPLLQSTALIKMLSSGFFVGKTIQIETNGTLIPPTALLPLVNSWVVDIKLPSSDCGQRPIADYHQFASEGEEVIFKILCSSIEDYPIAKRYAEHVKFDFAIGKYDPPTFCVSPELSAIGDYPFAQTLANLVIEDEYEIGFNLQIHKFIWPDGEKGDRALQ